MLPRSLPILWSTTCILSEWVSVWADSRCTTSVLSALKYFGRVDPKYRKEDIA